MNTGSKLEMAQSSGQEGMHITEAQLERLDEFFKESAFAYWSNGRFFARNSGGNGRVSAEAAMECFQMVAEVVGVTEGPHLFIDELNAHNNAYDEEQPHLEDWDDFVAWRDAR